MLNADAMFSSTSDNWSTPQSFFDGLAQEFPFELDVCASKDNAKCSRFFSKEDNGLDREWVGVCWMNPPYGRSIGAWIRKAYETAKHGEGTVVCLVPARTDTAWWHDYCAKGEVRFVRGRLKFGDAKTSAPFPSAVVIFRREVRDAQR